MKRYRKNLQEVNLLTEKPFLSLNQGDISRKPGDKKIETSRMSATDSLETMTVNKKQSLRRTESGSSIGTQVTGTQNANILDAARIERLLAVFNAIQSCKKQNEVLDINLFSDKFHV